MTSSHLERAFDTFFIQLCPNIEKPVKEFRFHPTRKWRFDFAWPELLLAIELEGGIWTKGRHTRGKGFINDCDKYNAATLLGWRVLRFTEDHLFSDPITMMKQIKQAYNKSPRI